MDINGILLRVRRTFGDESSVQITDEDIFRWISDAQREIVMHNESVLEKTTTIDTLKGVQVYDFPSDLYVIRSVRIKARVSDAYIHITGISPQEFDQYINETMRDVILGLPSVYTTYERKIFLFPIPDADTTAGLQVLYNAKPIDVTSSVDELSLPEEYHNAIVKFCLARANELDDEPELSNNHQAQFINDVRTLSLKDKYAPKESYPRITILPEDMW